MANETTLCPVCSTWAGNLADVVVSGHHKDCPRRLTHTATHRQDAEGTCPLCDTANDLLLPPDGALGQHRDWLAWAEQEPENTYGLTSYKKALEVARAVLDRCTFLHARLMAAWDRVARQSDALGKKAEKE